MQEFHVGELIRELRLRRDITQAQLCEGICDLATLSKIENGKRQPRRAALILLLQRLGVAEEQYHGLCSLDDLALEELKLAIRNANARFDYQTALELLDRLQKEHDCNNPIMEQFIVWTQAINGQLVNGEVVAYPLPQRLELLTKAIMCTAPSINLGDIGCSLLGLDEIKIILAIANVYSDMEKLDEAAAIYQQILQYTQAHSYNLSEKPTLISLITYNYSKVLGKQLHFEEELTVVDLGIKYCISDGRTRMLGKLMLNKACTLEELGLTREGKELGIQAYYFMLSMNMCGHAQPVADYLRQKYNWQPT